MPDKKKVTDPEILALFEASEDATPKSKEKITDPEILSLFEDVKKTTNIQNEQPMPATQKVEPYNPMGMFPEQVPSPASVKPVNSDFDPNQLVPGIKPEPKYPAMPVVEETPEQKQKREVKDRTTGAIDFVAKDLYENLRNLPEYEQNIKDNVLTSQSNIVNQITNPHGDPEVTANYLAKRMGVFNNNDVINLGGWESRPDIVKRGAGAVDSKSAQVKSELSKLIALQLFNKEHNKKAYTEDQRNTLLSQVEANETQDQTLQGVIAKLRDIEANPRNYAAGVKENYERELRKLEEPYNKKRNEILDKSKWDDTKLGAQYYAYLGDKKAQEDLRLINEGKAVSPEAQYKYQRAGIYEVKDVGLKNAELNNEEPVVSELKKHFGEDPKARLERQNKSFVVKQAMDDIANKKAADESAWRALIPSGAYKGITDEEIEKYGEGLSPEILAEIKKNKSEIPKTASIGERALKGFIGFHNDVAGNLYRHGITAGIGALTGRSKSETDELMNFYPGWQEDRGIVSKFIPAKNIPSSQNKLDNFKGIMGGVFETVGMLGAMGGGVNALAGELTTGAGMSAANAHTAANAGVMFLDGYSAGWDKSKEVLGDKPEDEGKRNLFAVLNGLVTATVFSISPSTKLVNKALGMETSAANDFLKEIRSMKGIENLEVGAIKGKLSKWIMAAAKEDGVQMSLMGANKAAENILENVFSDKKGKDITEGVKDEMIHAAMTMAIPSIAGGVGHVNSQNGLRAAHMYEIGKDPTRFTEDVHRMVSEGRMSPEDGQVSIDAINTMSKVILNTPEVNSEGKPLSPDYQKMYAFSSFQENVLNKKLEKITEKAKNAGLTPDKVVIDPIKEQIAKLQKEREEIYNRPTVASPAPPAEPEAASEVLPEPSTEVTETEVVQPTNKNVVETKEKVEEKAANWETLSKFAKEDGFVVTSTTGGTHNKGSKHGRGLAIDVRTRDKTPEQIEAFIQKAKDEGYIVHDERVHPKGQKVWSGPHLHIELPEGKKITIHPEGSEDFISPAKNTENGKSNETKGEAGNEDRSETSVQETADSEIGNEQQESRLLTEEVPGEVKTEEKEQGKVEEPAPIPVSETQPAEEQPSVVAEEPVKPIGKRKRLWREEPEVGDVETNKTIADATEKSSEQQQESTEQGRELERERVDTQREETAEPKPESSDSDIRSEKKEEVASQEPLPEVKSEVVEKAAEVASELDKPKSKEETGKEAKKVVDVFDTLATEYESSQSESVKNKKKKQIEKVLSSLPEPAAHFLRNEASVVSELKDKKLLKIKC